MVGEQGNTKQARRRRVAAIAAFVLAAAVCAAVPLGIQFGGPGAAAHISQPFGDRAVVVMEGGGSAHAYTTPWQACDDGRAPFIEALLRRGMPTFTAGAHVRLAASTSGKTGCPPPLDPRYEVPIGEDALSAGAGLARLLGYLHENFGFRTFDLVGYSYGGQVARGAIAAVRAGAVPGVRVASLTTLNSPLEGSYTYDLVANVTTDAAVMALVGLDGLIEARDLAAFVTDDDGALRGNLVTSVYRGPNNWNLAQVGALDGIAVTLIGGNYMGGGSTGLVENDGAVALYSQLLLSADVPPGLLPPGTVRHIFPTMHSVFSAIIRGLPLNLSASSFLPSVAAVVDAVAGHWAAEGVPFRQELI